MLFETMLQTLDLNHWIFLKLLAFPYFFRIEVLRQKTSHTVSVSKQMLFTYVVKTD